MSDLSAVVAKRENIRLGVLPSPEELKQFEEFQSAPERGGDGDPQHSTSEAVRDKTDPNRVAAQVTERQMREGVNLNEDTLTPQEREALTRGAETGSIGPRTRSARQPYSPPNPRTNGQSSSEQVRDRSEETFAEKLGRLAVHGTVGAAAGRAVAKRIKDQATGEEPGLVTQGAAAITRKVTGDEPQEGSLRLANFMDAVIQAVNTPSATAGEAVKHALTQFGVTGHDVPALGKILKDHFGVEESDLPHILGTVTELVSTGAFQGITGGQGIGALGGLTRKTATGAEGLMDTGRGIMAVDEALKGKSVKLAEKFDPAAWAAEKGLTYQGMGGDIFQGKDLRYHEFKEDAFTKGGNFGVRGGDITREQAEAELANHYKSFGVTNEAALAQVRRNEAELESGAAMLARAGAPRALAERIATLTAEGGGATFNIAEGRNLGGQPKFAVAIAPERGEIIDGLATPEQIERFIKRNRDLLSQPGANVGTWFNDGKTYLDISRAVDTQEEALRLGQQFRQKAISNLSNFEDINVPVASTSGHFVYDNPSMPLRDVDVTTAKAYDSLPEFDQAAVPAWDALANEVSRKFDEIVASGLRIEKVTGQPYQTAEEMAADIKRGVLKVTVDNSEHPLWDVDTNWKFRAWHDYEHHYLHGNDFSLDGEWRAYQVASNSVADPLARKALLTEVYGQAASAVANGGIFPPQKVALFDDAVEAAAKLPSTEDRLAAGAKSGIEKALENGRWTPSPGVAGAAAGAATLLTPEGGADAEGASQASVAAPIMTIAAALAARKKLTAIQKNALANKVAGLIWRGVRTEAEIGMRLQKEFGPGIANEVAAAWAKGNEQFDKILSGLKLRTPDDIEKFFKKGMDVAGQWEVPDWYGAGQEIAEMFGEDAELVAKLIAATSPQTAVQDIGAKKGNITLALEAYGMLKKGATREEIINHFDLSHGPNVWRAWQGEELQGNKVQDFWKAIYTSALGKGDESRAVIDSHMIGALVDPESNRITLPRGNSGGRVIFVTEDKTMKDSEYAALAQFVTDFANAHGVTPRQAQQAIWIGRKLEEGKEIGDSIEPLMQTLRRSWVEKGLEEEAFSFFESRPALALGSLALTLAAMNKNGDSDQAVEDYAAMAGIGGLINPKAAKALASVTRLMNRAKPSVEVGTATLLRADRMRAMDPSTLQVGKKLLSIDWSTMGHSVDNLKNTLQKIKEAYDVEGVHSVSRGIVSDADEAALAKYLREELGFDAEAVLNRAAGEGINSSWVWATADVVRKGLARLDELDRAVTAAAGTPGEIIAMIDYAEHAELVGALAKAFDGGAEEAGRALRAFQQAKDITGAPKVSFLKERHDRVARGIEKGFGTGVAKTADEAPGPLAGVKKAPPDQLPTAEPNNVPPGLSRLLEQGREIPEAGAAKAGPVKTDVNPLEDLINKGREIPEAPGGSTSQQSPFQSRSQVMGKGNFEQPLSAGAGEDPLDAVRRASGPKQGPLGVMNEVTQPSGPQKPESPLAQLRRTIQQGMQYGNEAGPGTTSAYEAMLKRPDVAEMLMSAQRLRDMLKNLPPANKPNLLKAIGSWGWDLGWEAFYDSLLKTIPGNFGNVVFNVGNLSRTAGVRYMSALEPSSRYTFAQANAYAGGIVQAMGEALVMAGKTFWKGESEFSQSQKMAGTVRAISGARAQQFAHEAGLVDQGVDLSEPVKTFFNAMGVALTTGTRGMMAEDEAFRVMGFRASLAEQATEAALLQGKVGSAEFLKARREALLNPTDEMIKIAKENAAYVTLTNSLGGSVGGLATFLRNPIVRPFVPFFSVSANVTAQNIEQLSGFSAIKMLQGKVAWDIKNGGPAGAIATYKTGVGTGLLMLGWWLYHNGQLTGRMPGEAQVKKNLTDQDIRPNSFVHIDDNGKRTYIGLDRMDGIAGPLLLIADVLDTYYAYTDEDGAPLLSQEWLAAAGAAITLGGWHNMMDRPWMKSTSDLFQALSMDDAKDAEKMVKALQNPVVAAATWPTGRAGAQIERARYRMIPETYDFVDKLYSQLPWGTLSYDPQTGEQRKSPWPFSSVLGERTLYPKRKANGDPYLSTPWEGGMSLTAWPSREGEPDTVSKLLYNNEVRIPRVPKTVAGAADTFLKRPNDGKPGGPELDAKSKDKIARLRGNGIVLDAQKEFGPIFEAFGYKGALPEGKMGMWDFLTQLEKTPTFRSLQSGPGSIQQDLLQSVINTYNRAAIKSVLVGDKKLMNQYLEYTKTRLGVKFGPGGREMAEQAIESPGGVREGLDAAMPELNDFLKERTR